jgi:hypothetical protein
MFKMDFFLGQLGLTWVDRGFMTNNSQPFAPINYNTDQFTDPISGVTVHDDGSPTYTSPYNLITYAKVRTINGFYPSSQGGLVNSFEITLVRPSYVTEDTTQKYVSENGVYAYVPGPSSVVLLVSDTDILLTSDTGIQLTP